MTWGRASRRPAPFADGVPAKPQFVRVLLCTAVMIAAAAPCAAASDDLLLSLDACIADTIAREEAEEAEEDEYGEYGYEDGPTGDAADSGEDSTGPDEPDLSELESYCPEVHAALDESSLAPYLEPDWEHNVSSSKLERLRSLLAEPVAPAARTLDAGSMAEIVERVRTSQAEKERSLWQRFKDWVRQLFDQQARSEDNAWLEDWLREHWPSDRVMKIIAYGILLILVGGLAWIVWIELRAAGVLGRRHQAAHAPAGMAAAKDTGRAQSLAEASEVERPGILIGLLLEQLRRLGRLQDRRSMTHREIGRAVHFASPADDEAFAGLLRLSEHLRYAPSAPPSSSVRTVVDNAQRLLDALAVQAVRTA
jgi:hypothetical protein